MNEEQKQNKESDQKFTLVELAPEQHAVTPVPKFVTELPFFYLTKQKKLLQQDIHYEGNDSFGNPVRWDVIPNRSPKIGVPSIEAHTIFTRLIKPTMEMYRKSDGQIPEIIPLGGIRECLRMIDWKAGGWEARGFLQGLMQIGQATCDFDFLLPTGAVDTEGKPLFKAIKGIFNRFSIWKIGSTHISEEELATGDFNFDFNLEDTVYIQLHKVERDIQRMQDQRYLDNQYMFSVEARARRWYELMAAKIFGVVKNRGSFCEIKYSWYVKHHHTLLRLGTRSRVVSQMNRIAHDHIMAAFITRVEYRTITGDDGQLDFLIRYYPGPAAKASVNRVLSFLNTSTFPALVSRRKNRRKQSPPLAIDDSAEAQNATEESSPESELGVTRSELAVDSEIVQELMKRDVVRSVALNLVVGKPAEQLLKIHDYVDYWDSLRYEKRPGLLVSLIQKREPLPPSFETRQQRAERQSAIEQRNRLVRVEKILQSKYENHCRQIIDRFIAEELPAGDFDRRVDEHKTETTNLPGVWNEGLRPDMAEHLARHAVRTEIAESIDLPPYADYHRQELPGVLAELQLDPADFGIVSDQPAVMAQEAVYELIENVSVQDEETPTFEEKSLPGSI